MDTNRIFEQIVAQEQELAKKGRTLFNRQLPIKSTLASVFLLVVAALVELNTTFAVIVTFWVLFAIIQAVRASAWGEISRAKLMLVWTRGVSLTIAVLLLLAAWAGMNPTTGDNIRQAQIQNQKWQTLSDAYLITMSGTLEERKANYDQALVSQTPLASGMRVVSAEGSGWYKVQNSQVSGCANITPGAEQIKPNCPATNVTTGSSNQPQS